MFRFREKTIIVTGASAGIGLATAQRFLAEGGNIVAVSRTESNLEEAFHDDNHDRLRLVAGDAADPAIAQKAIDTATTVFGGVDVLVNNVGAPLAGTVTTTEVDAWNELLRSNITSAFLFARAAMPELVKRRGSIVQVSSVQGNRADYGWAAYNTSKGALESMTRSMALDHGADGVRVNAVAPGVIATPRTATAPPDKLATIVARTPLGRVGAAADVASVIAFLASDDAAFVTGAVVPVDGGLTASLGAARP